MEAATKEGIEQFTERKRREQRGKEFWAALDQEVYKLKYERMCRDSKVNPYPFGMAFASHRNRRVSILRDDTGALFADHTARVIDVKPVKKKDFSERFAPYEPVQKERERSARHTIDPSEKITVDNFFKQTKGVFDQIKEIPSGFIQIFKSKGSEYYTNDAKTHIVRVSDHWGWFIRDCDWFLKMDANKKVKRMSSFGWSKKFNKQKSIGIIHISNLIYNNHELRPKPKPKKVVT